MVIEATQVTMNPFRSAIAEILTKMWKAKNQEVRQQDLTKWGDFASKQKIVKAEGSSLSGIGKYMKSAAPPNPGTKN